MRSLGYGAMWLLMAVAVTAQQPAKPPAKTMSGSLGLYVFPAANQAPDVQQNDEAGCYSWAKENTGFDPLASASSAGQTVQSQAPKGEVAKSAAGGAAVGAVIGAITGDPGEGAAAGAAGGAIRGRIARRRGERQAKEKQAQAEKRQSNGMDGFRKAFRACMESKGYTVK